MKPKHYIFYFLCLLFYNATFSQDGSLDTSFGDNGTVVTDFSNGNDYCYSIAQATDGKLLVIGQTGDLFESLPSIIRYREDGSLDSFFGNNGRITFEYGSGYNELDKIFAQSEAKFLVKGRVDVFNIADAIILQYLSDGSLDNSFGTNGHVLISQQDFEVSEIGLDTDENILLFGSTNNQNTLTFSRLMPNGSLDTSFGDNGYATSNNNYGNFRIDEIKILDTGEILILGHNDTTTDSDIILLKFLSTGYLDTNFGNNGLVVKTFTHPTDNSHSYISLDVRNSSEILIAGSIGRCVNGSNAVYQPFLLQYQANGSLDPSFGNNGILLRPISSFVIRQVIIQYNGKILIRGLSPDCFEGAYFVITRYNPDGSHDYTFSGYANELSGTDMILQSDGKIVGLAYTWWYAGDEDFFMVRLNNDPLSIAENNLSNLVIYPNPSNGIFTLRTMSGFASEMPYVVTDVSGKIIQKSTITDIDSEIDLSEAANGIYFLRVDTYTYKLLKN